MIRTFIGCGISEKLRERLGREMLRLRAAAPLVAWVKPENVHLTLKFLGDVKEDDLQELFDALAEEATGSGPFSLEVRGVGAFPNWRNPRVVWAGIGEGAEEAVGLAEMVEGVCVDLGYEAEGRVFRPHLTLGRVKRPADGYGLEEVARGLESVEFGHIDVDEVVVFMSSLRRTGPVYSPMARFELVGAG